MMENPAVARIKVLAEHALPKAFEEKNVSQIIIT